MKVASCRRIVHVPVWPDMSRERCVPKNVAADCGLWTLGGTALAKPPAETTINHLSPCTAKNGSSQETSCKVSSSCWFHVWCVEAKLNWRQRADRL